MSVRAIAIRNSPRPLMLRAARRARRPARSTFLTRFADDRRLIGVKILLVGLLLLAAMALEVPL